MIRTTVRVPDDLYARIRVAAEREHRSIHGQILELLERAIRDDERGSSRP